MRSVVMLSIAAMLCLGAYFGYGAWGGSAKTMPYKTEVLERGTLLSTAMASGTIEPVLKVLVGSQVSGTVVKWYTDFNQTVKQGDILAELDQDRLKATIAQQSAAVAVAKARQEEAAANLSEASLELRRIERAYRQNAASDFERDVARAGEQARRAALHAAQAQVLMAQAELQAAEIQLDKTIIRSPIDGVVISRNVDEGQTVAASLSAPTLFTIANDLRHMRVNAAVSETDIGQIRENMSAEFRVDAYPKLRFTGNVSQVRYAETVVDNVVTYETLIEVENPDLLLRPGMTATIIFVVDKAEDVLMVPNAALRFEPKRKPQVTNWRKPGRAQPLQSRVYKIVDGELIEAAVELGINDGSYTQLISGELTEGDTVVVGWDLMARPAAARRPRAF